MTSMFCVWVFPDTCAIHLLTFYQIVNLIHILPMGDLCFAETDIQCHQNK